MATLTVIFTASRPIPKSRESKEFEYDKTSFTLGYGFPKLM